MDPQVTAANRCGEEGFALVLALLALMVLAAIATAAAVAAVGQLRAAGMSRANDMSAFRSTQCVRFSVPPPPRRA